MTTWYSYYRNFHPLSSKPTGVSGGYNINDYLSPPKNGAKVVDDRIANELENISNFMIGRSDDVNTALNSAMYIYKNFLTPQVGSSEGDERWHMVLNWQQYNKNEVIKKQPQWTALALAMLYIVDGWRILGGRVNARKYRRFIRGRLRPLASDNPLKIAYTAVSKIMHNPINAGDHVLRKVEKMRDDNLDEMMWGNIYAPRLLRLGVPKLRESAYYNLAEVANNPSLLGKERPKVKVEEM